jgi:hypothetical protein
MGKISLNRLINPSEEAYEFNAFFSHPLFYKRNTVYVDLSISCFLELPYLQKIDVLVGVINLAVNFDTLGKNSLRGFWSTKSKFWHFIDPDFIRTVDFFSKGVT